VTAAPTGDPAVPPTSRVVAFSGSLRKGSSNSALVHLAARVAPVELDVQVVDWIDQLPYYNADLEADPPDAVVRWRQVISAADAVVMAVPEYNFGPSAVAKNAIDWLTRPLGEHPLKGKVIALMSSAGKGGGGRVQASLAPILGLLGNTVIDDPVVQIALGATRIMADGQIEDQEIIDLVSATMANVALELTTSAAITAAE
jgi:chromate reductase, NAD(P)H dehydrogenase (quinone)